MTETANRPTSYAAEDHGRVPAFVVYVIYIAGVCTANLLSPIGVIIAGIVLAITYVGGDMAQSALQLPNASKGIFQAMMLFFLLASDILIRYRVRLVAQASPATQSATPVKSAA